MDTQRKGPLPSIRGWGPVVAPETGLADAEDCGGVDAAVAALAILEVDGPLAALGRAGATELERVGELLGSDLVALGIVDGHGLLLG